MSGASALSSVGDIGLQITNKSEPNITVVTSQRRTRVYVRRTAIWKEAIAEFVDPAHGDFFAEALRLTAKCKADKKT